MGRSGWLNGAAWTVRAVGINIDYNIFLDETTYTRIADNLATGRGLTLYGTPYDLHPPAGFAILAAAIKIFSMHGDLATVLFDLRPFVALLGALTCGLAFILVGRLVNWQGRLRCGRDHRARPLRGLLRQPGNARNARATGRDRQRGAFRGIGRPGERTPVMAAHRLRRPGRQASRSASRKTSA